jgi:hypothetical protein
MPPAPPSEGSVTSSYDTEVAYDRDTGNESNDSAEFDSDDSTARRRIDQTRGGCALPTYFHDTRAIVDAVIPRRRGNEKKVVLTRALLESHLHESLDVVSEKLGLSKTTIKAACRRLGLKKWPYQHSGPRKRRLAPAKSFKASDSKMAPGVTSMAHQGDGLSIGNLLSFPTGGIPPGTTFCPLISNSLNSKLSNDNQNVMRNIQLNNMATMQAPLQDPTSILTELIQRQLAVLPLQQQLMGSPLQQQLAGAQQLQQQLAVQLIALAGAATAH